MREIKFRGYNAKNKEWLYGCYLINRGEHFICPDGIQPPDKTPEDYQVIPETLGQFTGLHDCNGKEIYEGDIIKSKYTTYIVKWNKKCAYFSIQEDETPHLLADYNNDIEIIGNVYTNPELLKGGEE